MSVYASDQCAADRIKVVGGKVTSRSNQGKWELVVCPCSSVGRCAYSGNYFVVILRIIMDSTDQSHSTLQPPWFANGPAKMWQCGWPLSI